MMSNTVTTADGRTLTSALSKLSESNSNVQGALIIVRPSKLAEAGTTGVVAEGLYEGAVENKFDNTKLDYKVRATNGDLYILNSTASLAKQMSVAELGDYVQITYNGKETITKGKSKGKSAHRFEVFIG